MYTRILPANIEFHSLFLAVVLLFPYFLKLNSNLDVFDYLLGITVYDATSFLFNISGYTGYNLFCFCVNNGRDRIVDYHYSDNIVSLHLKLNNTKCKPNFRPS